MSQNSFVGAAALAAVTVVVGVADSVALALPIYSGPTYDTTTQTGSAGMSLPVSPGSTAGSGLAVGTSSKYSNGIDLGGRAFRWDTSGTSAIELGHLGTSASGYTSSGAWAISTTGAVVGLANKYSGGTLLGERAVRWDSAGTAATELGHIGTNNSGFTNNIAWAVNSAGSAVGYANKYSGNTYLGDRAVRWDASGTAATELGHIGTNSSGVTTSAAYAINTGGTAVGFANKYSGNVNLGARAVLWHASGSGATELGILSTNNSGVTDSFAFAINTAGTAVGRANRYSGNVNLGTMAVRWDASGTVATELGHLGTSSSGSTLCVARDINTSGTAIGSAEKYSGGAFKGYRAVRWNASGTAASELGILGTNSSGATSSDANSINSSGFVVGYAYLYSGSISLGSRAVFWGLDGLAVDLNSLLSSADAALWTLTEARDISDTNWITGIGNFDPDGNGNLPSYQRGFLLQIPAPSSAVLLGLVATLAASRRRDRTV